MASPSDGPTARFPRATPPWVRLPKVEFVLGRPLTELSWEVVEQLVAHGAVENSALELKRQPYGPRDDDKRELCKDVASLANAGGGLILIGVDEDQEGRASEIRAIHNLDSEVLRITEILIRGVVPWIRDFSVVELLGPDDAGVLALVVPDSQAAPHAVRRDDWLGWPIRQDRLTRWMQEPELASRYRNRFRSAGDAERRMSEVEAAGQSCLGGPEACWLAISLVPSQQGVWIAERDRYREWLRDATTDLPVSIGMETAVLGRRRVVFTDRWAYRGYSRDHHLELHQDGSAFAALVVTERRPILDVARLDLPAHIAFDTDGVSTWTVALLGILARHAVNAGGSGEFLVHVQLLTGVVEDGSDQVDQQLPLIPAEPFANGGLSGIRVVPGARVMRTPTAVELVATPDIASAPSALVGVAAEAVHEVIAEFGCVASDELLTRDGSVTYRRNEAASGPLFGWARNEKLLIGE